MGINGTAVAVTTVGGLLLYSAVKGMGIGDTAHSLLSGKPVATPAGLSGGAALQDLLTSPLAGPGGTLNGATGGNMAPAINTYLKGMNFTRAQRAGIMGNMQIESGFNPAAISPVGAVGICQWMGSRRTALQKLAVTIGKDESDLAAQLAYFHLEMNSAFAPVRVMIHASSSPATVAIIFDKSYEKSAGTSRDARVTAAQSLFVSAVTA